MMVNIISGHFKLNLLSVLILHMTTELLTEIRPYQRPAVILWQHIKTGRSCSRGLINPIINEETDVSSSLDWLQSAGLILHPHDSSQVHRRESPRDVRPHLSTLISPFLEVTFGKWCIVCDGSGLQLRPRSKCELCVGWVQSRAELNAPLLYHT